MSTNVLSFDPVMPASPEPENERPCAVRAIQLPCQAEPRPLQDAFARVVEKRPVALRCVGIARGNFCAPGAAQSLGSGCGRPSAAQLRSGRLSQGTRSEKQSQEQAADFEPAKCPRRDSSAKAHFYENTHFPHGLQAVLSGLKSGTSTEVSHRLGSPSLPPAACSIS
jgi:hypothetical protein